MVGFDKMDMDMDIAILFTDVSYLKKKIFMKLN